MKEIYLDNSSTTKPYKEVINAVNKAMNIYGNPSSQHKLGEEAKKEINSSREKLAREINCKPWEIVFTSGGTESNNMALFGLAKASNKKTIMISSIEHASVVEPCNQLIKWGYKIIKIPVSKEGIVDISFIERELNKNKDIFVVSVIHTNNIIGTIQDISKIGAICAKNKVLFHVDAVQSFGKLDIDVKKENISLLSASAHKIGGLKGVGLLYIKEGTNIEPIIFGGGQEKSMRSGTENVPGIIGFAKALEIVKKIDKDKIRKNRDYLIRELIKINGKINGSIDKRIYNNVHVSFSNVDSSYLVSFLSSKGIYVSTGSACESNKEKEDHVLNSIGLDKNLINGSIRISLNEEIDRKEINYFILKLKEGLKLAKK